MTDHDDAVAPALFSPDGDTESFARLLATRIEQARGGPSLVVSVGVWQTARVRRWIWGLMAVVVAVVVATAHAATTQPVVFTKTPPKQTNSTSAHFEWTGTGPYKCSLDGATLATCASPQDLSGLSEGPHKFSVQGSGTGVTPPPPVEYDWTVDLTPPTTVVTQKPPALSNSTSATFEFNSPDPTARSSAR